MVRFIRKPSAIHLLEKNIDKIDWDNLSSNPRAIHLLEKNIDIIDWDNLSLNPNAIHLLENNFEQIEWSVLSRNPNAIHLLEKNIDKINWDCLLLNENAMHFFERLDYNYMKDGREDFNNFRQELAEYVFSPVRLERLCERYGVEFIDIVEMY